MPTQILGGARMDQSEQTEVAQPQESANSEQKSESAESAESAESREERRAQHDFLRFKQEARKLAEENEKLRNQLQSIEQQNLISQNRFKEAYEMEMRKREELEGQLTETKKTFWNGLKYQEIKSQALKAGIRPEAIDDLSLYDASEVEVETTSHGNANILGAREFIEKLKITRPYMFQDNRPPNVNNATPMESKQKEFSAFDLLKMQKENPAKYRQLMQEKYFK